MVNVPSVPGFYFDNASRLYHVTQGSTSTLIAYDSANRRNSLTLPNGIVLTYGYNSDSRITSMSYQIGTTSVGNLTYQYDADGRRTQMGGSLAATGFPQAVSSAAYDVANELTNWNGTTIGYDANGNIQNDGVAAYTWNGRNQLISRGSSSLQYDTFGRRTLNPAGKNLLYEGWNVAQELSGTTPVANRILGGIDEFFNQTDSTGAYSPIKDAQGNVLALTNSAGSITTQYGYDPFGNTTTYGGANNNVSQYTGRENDGNGLYAYRARYYSSTLGRFVSEDPIGFGGGINVYAYAGDSPTNFADPFGLESTLTASPTVTQEYPGTPSPAEVEEALDQVETATAAEEAGTEAAVAAGWGAAAATVGVAGVDVALGWYDYNEFRKLCDASSWAWCSNLPSPQPGPSPSPDSGSMAGRGCKTGNPLLDCLRQFAKDLQDCTGAYPPGPQREACFAAAKRKFDACKKFIDLPPDGPVN